MVTAFVNVNVVPMDTERLLVNQTVLVEGGRITALGAATAVEVPAGAVRIDGRGKYLIPGLGNMHWHGPRSPGEMDQTFKSEEGMRAIADKYLAMGVTAVRTLESPHLNEMRQLRRLLDAGKFPSPRMYLARDVPFSMRRRPGSVAAFVEESKAAGYHHLGTGYGLTAREPEERAVFDSLVAAARRAGLPVSAHSHALPFDASLTLGATGGSTDHLFLFWDSLVGIPGPLSTYGIAERSEPVELPMAKVPPLVAAVKQAGVWITPTLACLQLVHSHIQGLPTLVKALQEADVGMLLSADDGLTVQDELAALVDAGLTPYQALVTGTRNVAQYFRLLDSVGTVAVNKWADLVLLNGNPLQDIRHTRELAGVMIGGNGSTRSRWTSANADPYPKFYIPGLPRRRLGRGSTQELDYRVMV